MAKPRIIIAEKDKSIVMPLQFKFLKEFFEKVDIEVISDEAYFKEYFSTPQMTDILIISEDFYTPEIQRHNITHTFLMCEDYNEERTGSLNLNCILKYTSIKEIFNEIVNKSSDVLKVDRDTKQETQVVVFYSASGGTGKTTCAMGVCAALTQNFKKVLYLNAARLQVFQNMLQTNTPISMADVYARLATADANIYFDIKHVIRKEMFNYLPPFKAALMSIGLDYSVYEKIILSAKKSGDYDFIIVDSDVVFDEYKASLLNIADKVVLVINQTLSSILATNILVSNINGLSAEKYIFICNNFKENEANSLISPNISLKFTVSEYVENFDNYEMMKPNDFAKKNSIQKIAYLVS